MTSNVVKLQARRTIKAQLLVVLLGEWSGNNHVLLPTS
jgi:hypothetical protein